MASIANATQECLLDFTRLCTYLENGESIHTVHKQLMPPASLRHEQGRLKIWAGNLGALQRGRSSLDFRLRDSTAMQINVLKLLDQMKSELRESINVVTGARLPWEKQTPQSQNSSDEDSSEGSDDEPSGIKSSSPTTELGYHSSTISAIVNDLYRLSFQVRVPSSRSMSSKVALYKEVDKETSVDVLSGYEIYDQRHVEESLRLIRAGRTLAPGEQDQFLPDRLSKAITSRRRCFKYWRRHTQKLAKHDQDFEKRLFPQARGTEAGHSVADLGKDPAVKIITANVPASQAGNTILSATEATKYNRNLDDLQELQSNISYATTAYDVQGNTVELPAPPTLEVNQAEFTCPYCHVVCPARHARGKAWRSHVLQDMQPYVCTYPRCPEPDRLYGSRHSWLEHERLFHRRVWQCFEHAGKLFATQGQLQSHLEEFHKELAQGQIANLLDLSQLTTDDDRPLCPFCLISGPFPHGLGNHMAFHHEKIACFSLPRGATSDEDKTAEGSQSSLANGVMSRESLDSVSLSFESTPETKDGSTHEEHNDEGEGQVVDIEVISDEEDEDDDEGKRDREGKMGEEEGESQDDQSSTSQPRRKKPPLLYYGQELEAVPPKLKEEGDGWVAVHNPEVSRAIGVKLLQSIRQDSIATCVAFGYNGESLIVGGENKTTVFQIHTGVRIAVITHQHDTDISECYTRDVSISLDGRYLGMGTECKKVLVWDTRKEEITHTFLGHEQAVYGIDISSDGHFVASASGDNTVRIWDMKETNPRWRLETQDGLTSVAISPNMKLIAAGCLDKCVYLWDFETGVQITRLRGHSDSVYGIGFHPRSNVLVSDGLDKSVRIWLLPHIPWDSSLKESFSEFQILTGHQDFVLSSCYSSDGSCIISGSKDSTVRFWDSTTGISHIILHGHTNSVIKVCAHPTLQMFATAGADKYAKIWVYDIFRNGEDGGEPLNAQEY